MKDTHKWVAELEALLEGPEDQSLPDWIKRRRKQFDGDFAAAADQVVQNGLNDSSIEGSVRLVRLSALLTEVISHARPDAAPSLVWTLKTLEEDGIGPRPAVWNDVNEVYKRVLNYRGCRLAEQGLFDAAIAHFDVTLRIDAAFVPAYCNRARAKLELGLLDDARTDAEEALRRDSAYPESRAIGLLVEAVRTLRTESRRDPSELATEAGLLETLRTYDRPRA